jgi:hypothetical protein
VKRLALLALLLASSCVVAAPAPLPKAKRKAERAAAVQQPAAYVVYGTDEQVLVGFRINVPPLGPAQPAPPQAPAQPLNPDPPR